MRSMRSFSARAKHESTRGAVPAAVADRLLRTAQRRLPDRERVSDVIKERRTGDRAGCRRPITTTPPSCDSILDVPLRAGSEDELGAETIHHLSGGDGQRAGGCSNQV
jgi:hypothetical protein